MVAFLAFAAFGLAAEIVFGRVVWGFVFEAVVVGAAVDYWRLRSSSASPERVADRLVFYIVIMAMGLASPGIDAFEAWLGHP